MAKKDQTITIVTLIENNPITGVKYGEQEITLNEEIDITRQKHIDRYKKVRNNHKRFVQQNRANQKQ